MEVEGPAKVVKFSIQYYYIIFEWAMPMLLIRMGASAPIAPMVPPPIRT